MHLAGLIRFGNKKLPRTTAVFSMCAATDCPARRLGFCQAVDGDRNVCYARRTERQWAHVLKHRRGCARYWRRTRADTFAREFLEIVDRRKTLTTALRLNVAGDFRTQQDVITAHLIACHLSMYGIITYGYTARRDLDFGDSTGRGGLILMGSGFKAPGIAGEFRFITDLKQRPKGYGLCPGDCRTCTRCLRGRDTCVMLH
jgi:hypothetical protein